jgi:hypothetical protein
MAVLLNLGVDRGNTRTNVAAITDASTIVELDASSMVATGNIEKVKKVMAGTGGSLDMGVLDYVTEYEGMTYLLSDLAVEQGIKYTTGIGDKKRYEGKHTKVAIMTFADILARRLYSGHNFSEIVINLVMGVPFQVYLTQAEAIVESLVGSYTYLHNNREMTLHIDSVKVFMEGAGAAIYHGLEKGAIVGVVDSGSLTTNILRFDGTRPNVDKCDSFEIGIHSALQLASERVNVKHGRPLNEKEQQQLLYASIGRGPLPAVYVQGVQIPGEVLFDYMRAAISEIGGERNTRISAKWNEHSNVAADFKKILHVGGGAYYLQSSLQNIISNAEIVTDAEKANARGYSIIANQIAQRKALKRA